MTHKKANPEHVTLLKEAGITVEWGGYTLTDGFEPKRPVWRFNGVKLKCGGLTLETEYAAGIGCAVPKSPERNRFDTESAYNAYNLSREELNIIRSAGTCDTERTAFDIAWATFSDAELYENHPDIDDMAEAVGGFNKPSDAIKSFEAARKADAFWRHVDAPALKEALRNY